MEKKFNSLHHYVFLVITIIFLILSYLILKPYITALISAFIIAYLIRPLYILLSKKLNSSLSAILSIALLIVLILLPFLLILNALLHQIISASNSGSLSDTLELFSDSLGELSSQFDISGIQRGVSNWLLSGLTNILSSIPLFILTIFITFFSVYYILTNWNSLSRNLLLTIPFKDKERISKEISNSTSQIIYGYALIALIEFIVALIGFKIAGVDFYLLFPLLIAIFAFLPLLGPALVWVPLAGYYFITSNNYTALGVVITGLIISIILDTFLAPKIIGDKAKVHPLLMLLGVIGGVPIFGIFGIIIGPLLLVYTIKLITEALQNN